MLLRSMEETRDELLQVMPVKVQGLLLGSQFRSWFGYESEDLKDKSFWVSPLMEEAEA